MRIRPITLGTSLGALTLVAVALAAPSANAAAPEPSMRFIAASSSNYSRRSSRRITRIVIHTTEGSESSAINWFKNPRSKVSAHYIVAKSGRITRMVQDKDVAFHVRNYNSNSIGIENEGFAHRNTWTAVQVDALKRLVRYLCEKHGVPKNRSAIVGHNELDPSRRSDPGPYFDWNGLIRDIKGGSSGGGGGGGGVKPPPPPPPPSGSRGVEVTAGSLRVRSGVWGTILGSVSRGDRFVLTGRTSGAWREIFWSGRQGWVHGDYLRSVGGTGLQGTAGTLNVRTGPSTGNTRFGWIRAGQRYVQVGSSGSWRKVQYDDRQGWAHGNWLRPLSLSR